MSTLVTPSPNSPHQPGVGPRYGALGIALAFVSLPLYITLPHHYAQHFGVPLAWLGSVLLLTRLLDAVIDPQIGQWLDQGFARGTEWVWRVGLLAGLTMATGFIALWWPPAAIANHLPSLMAWLLGALLITCLGYSVLSVTHQAWGARWGGDASQRARLVAWREGAALLGVLLASVLPSLVGLAANAVALMIALVVGLVLLGSTSGLRADALLQSSHTPPAVQKYRPPLTPWSSPAFRALLGVFVLNGIASAIPATLVSFFVHDRLNAGALEPLFLGSYFACAALALPLWVRLVRRIGLVDTWLSGMGLSVMAFMAVPWLGAGDSVGFWLVCCASGAALGADLAVPSALLTGVIAQAGATGRGEGRFFGWWAFATKLNLALAAGVALPLLGLLGYTVNTQEPEALKVLTWAYGGVPCAMKIISMYALYALARPQFPSDFQPLKVPS